MNEYVCELSGSIPAVPCQLILQLTLKHLVPPVSAHPKALVSTKQRLTQDVESCVSSAIQTRTIIQF